MKYNKLIRDKIPEIMKNKGVTFKTHLASQKEYEEKLREKLQEEVNEFLEDPSKEELADILEVIYALCDSHNFDKKEIEQIRKNKANKRGEFKEKIILDEATD